MEHSKCTIEYLKLCAAVYYKKVVLRFILGSPIKSYRHQTIQGKKEFLIPNFIVARQTKVKRRFSYLILLSPDKQRNKRESTGTNTTPHPPPVTAPRHTTTHHHTAKSHQSGPQKYITSLHSTTTKTHQSELCQNSSI